MTRTNLSYAMETIENHQGWNLENFDQGGLTDLVAEYIAADDDRTCQRCGHTWTPDAPNPKRCPGCGSVYWATPRQQARRYYAVEYAYGASVVNNGARADTVRRFATEAERGAWVSQSNPVNQAGFRLPVKADHPAVRRLRRAEAEHGEQVWHQE